MKIYGFSLFKILIFALLFANSNLAGQPVKLNLQVAGDSSFFQEQFSIPEKFSSYYEIELKLKNTLKRIWEEGYLAATIDSIHKKDSGLYKATLYTGKQYEWVQLNPGNVDEGWLRKKGYSGLEFRDKPFFYEELSDLMNDLLEYAQNNGYPFANLRLKDVRIKENNIKGALHIDKGPRIVFGEVEILGNAEVSKKYLRNYLRLDSGQAYSEKAVRKVKSRANQLAFLSSPRNPDVLFKKERADLKLYLEKEPASRINGIIGLAPRGGQDNGFLLTGELTLNLQNPFGKAMNFDLEWRKLQERSQELHMNYLYPYFLDLPIGLDASLNLLKYDTLYLNVGWELGVRYLFSGNNYGKIFYESQISNLINPSAFSRHNLGDQFASYDVRFYGLEGHYENLDYRLNPTKGWRLEIRGSVGQKSINDNANIESRFTDSLDKRSVIYKFRFLGQYFFRLGNSSTLMFKVEGRHLIDDQILRNQLFQFGGFGSLRGFDDGSLLASTYGIGTIEYRFLTGKNDFLSVFGDVAYYERDVRKNNQSDTPFGLGLGYTFETKVGLFSINYASGKRMNQTLNFRDGKIHFGFTNRF